MIGDGWEHDRTRACLVCDGGLPTVEWSTLLEVPATRVRVSFQVCALCQHKLSQAALDAIKREVLGIMEHISKASRELMPPLEVPEVQT